ncbi:class I SAM-dependent methyltransferase [Sphingomonas montana]|uniref:class I SAM-dependent methyltransferase n=1 Tax=Sphingomonas montana TaxID=1843236 RepID=UPI0009FB131B|nr:SAM-dependent methyltransferase [Sphingomonas montana]
MPIDRWMDAANSHYYATRDPLGTSGDFTTAPEISQMFGELAGLWLADLWDRTGRPPAAYVELGPGRGTLAVDALRAMRTAGLVPFVHLVETSPALRAAQAERLPGAHWHTDVTTLPADCALLVVANEFFDALPITQAIRTVDGWRERVVIDNDGEFAFAIGDPVAGPKNAPDAAIVENRPVAGAILSALAPRIACQGGSLLTIDYGYPGPAFGDTLQAVRAHRFVDPLVTPGDTDLTAHVDFTALAAAAAPLVASGPVDQGEWLLRLGIATRAAALARATPDQGETIAAAYRRLTAPDAMGHLFKVLALTAPSWPEPAGLRG